MTALPILLAAAAVVRACVFAVAAERLPESIWMIVWNAS